MTCFCVGFFSTHLKCTWINKLISSCFSYGWTMCRKKNKFDNQLLLRMVFICKEQLNGDEFFYYVQFRVFLRNTYFLMYCYIMWGKYNFSELWMLMLFKKIVRGIYIFSEMWILMLFRWASTSFDVKCLFTHFHIQRKKFSKIIRT